MLDAVSRMTAVILHASDANPVWSCFPVADKFP